MLAQEFDIYLNRRGHHPRGDCSSGKCLSQHCAVKYSQQNPHGLNIGQDSGGWIRLSTLSAMCNVALGFPGDGTPRSIGDILSLISYANIPTLQVSLEVALGGKGTDTGFLHIRKPGTVMSQVTDDGKVMDSVRRPFAVRIVEGIQYAPHLSWLRFEPRADIQAFDLAAGIFFLCDQIDLPYIFKHGIHNAGSGNMRTYFEAFIPSDPRCRVRRLRWATTTEPCREKLTCIALSMEAFMTYDPHIGQNGRFSLPGNFRIKSEDILSIWVYDSIDFEAMKLVYHKQLISTQVTGYCGGDRSAGTEEHLERLRDLLRETLKPRAAMPSRILRASHTLNLFKDTIRTVSDDRIKLLILDTNVFSEAERNSFDVEFIMRCPCCCTVSPSGFTFCMDCLTIYCRDGSEKMPACLAAALPFEN